MQTDERSKFVCIHRHQLIWMHDHLEWQGAERGFIDPSMFTKKADFWYHVTENPAKDQVHFIAKHPCATFAEFDEEIWYGEKLGAFWQQLTASQWLLTCFNVQTRSDCGFREMRLKTNSECKNHGILFLNNELRKKFLE